MVEMRNSRSHLPFGVFKNYVNLLNGLVAIELHCFVCYPMLC